LELVISVLIALMLGAAAGGGVAYIWRQRTAATAALLARANAERLEAEAAARRNEILAEANAEALRLRSAVEAEARERRRELQHAERRLQQKEENLDRKLDQLERRERQLAQREREVEQRHCEIDAAVQRQLQELERIAGLTREEARAELMARVEQEARVEAGRLAREIIAAAREDAETEARRIITLAIQRLAAEQCAESTVSVVPIPSEEMKGRIIGREGRNIRALEHATGVDLIIDDTPDAVTLSGFDPVRREIARIALTKLVMDGRIHPARIEEMVAKAKQEVEQQIKQAGEAAALEAGVHGLHPELIKMLGRMKFRTSYGQNQLRHSVEAALIAGLLAQELGADANTARRAALLHDIGKTVTHEVDAPHHVIAADLARRFGESPKVAQAIIDHHDADPDHQSIESLLVQIADAISGARPGARRETVEHYVRRLEALENVANSFEGVERSFAIQAGREVRIIVRPEQVDDLSAMRLARDVVKKIEETLQYPGQVKVTVLRETRAVEYAR
jgi:ribonuclease Y